MLDLDAVARAPVASEPFDFLIATGTLAADLRPQLERDFPAIGRPGSFPVDGLRYGPTFRTLLAELRGPALAAVLSAKLGVDLAAHPTMVTVRGRCHARRDGHVHTDSTWKLVSLLLYLNADWQGEGGRLRLLRSPDLDDVAAEVPPSWGALVAFRRSDRSFHGHEPFEGERRVVQVNWVTSQATIDRELARHRRTAWLKRILPLGYT